MLLKMKKLLLLVLLALPIVSFGQVTTTENYIHTKTYQEATTAPTANTKQIENVVYYDGLGRPLQAISVKGSNNQEDIVSPITYDALGRQSKNYMPYMDNGSNATSNSNFKDYTFDAQSAFYLTTKYENTLNPYSETAYERSPLGRVVEQAAPGNDWKYDPNNKAYEGQTTTVYPAGTFADHYACWNYNDFVNT